MFVFDMIDSFPHWMTLLFSYQCASYNCFCLWGWKVHIFKEQAILSEITEDVGIPGGVLVELCVLDHLKIIVVFIDSVEWYLISCCHLSAWCITHYSNNKIISHTRTWNIITKETFLYLIKLTIERFSKKEGKVNLFSPLFHRELNQKSICWSMISTLCWVYSMRWKLVGLGKSLEKVLCVFCKLLVFLITITISKLTHTHSITFCLLLDKYKYQLNLPFMSSLSLRS